MTRETLRKAVGWGCRCLVGGVFFYAGAVKLEDMVAFAGEIAGYRLLPYALNYLVAAVLPCVEIMTGTLLLLGCRVRGAALLAGGLNLVFILALLSALARGLDISCGCFGSERGGAGVTEALLRDVVLMAAVAVAFYSAPESAAAAVPD